MLTKVPFYFGTTRNMVIAFGSLFSDIFCVTKNADGTTKKIVNVPLTYANKEKFIVRLTQDPGLNEDVQITLPRLGYEIVGFDYDSTRQLNKTNKVLGVKDATSVMSYSPAPYIITFNLYSFTRTQEDNLQIMEQILPFFTPDMNLSIKVMANPEVIQDCQLVLNSLSTDDSYDGAFEERRYIITTYAFSLKMNYYSPLLGIGDPSNHFEPGPPSPVIKSVDVNLNRNKYNVKIDPMSANATDVFTTPASWTENGNPDYVPL